MAKRIFLCLSVVFMAFASLATHTEAAGTSPCTLDSDKFDKLQSIENNFALDYSARIKMGLALRKELLTDTVQCAIQNAKDLQSNLSSVSIDDESIARLQTSALSQIANAISYYELQRSQINDLGLQGSYDFAASLEAWRKGNYNPLVQESQNLILWSHNQALLATAQNRMNQVGHMVSFVQIVGNDDIQNIWTDAQNNFNNALSFNQQAGNSLRNINDQSQTLDLMKSFLASLFITYQKLFDLSGVLNKIVG